MPLHPVVAFSIDELRARTGELLDRARVETTEQVAQLSGRGAGWVDKAGQLVADSTVTLAAQLTEVAGAHAARVAGRLAGAVDRWSADLGDRMVRLGEELAESRRDG